MATGATVPGLYLHIAHLVDKEEGEIPQPFKGAKLKQTRGRGKPKGKPQEQRQNPPKAQEADEIYTYDSPNNYYHNDNYTATSQSQAADPLMVKAGTDNLEASHNEIEAKNLNIVNINFRTINFRETHFNRTILNTATIANPTFREIKQIATEAEAVAGVLSNLEDVVMAEPIIRVAMECTSISITCMTHRQNSMVHLVVYVAVLIIPLSTVTRENMT